MSSNLSQIRPWTAELAALECLKNQFFSVVATPASSILIRFSKQKKKKQKKKKNKKKKTKKKTKTKKKNTLSSDCTC